MNGVLGSPSSRGVFGLRTDVFYLSDVFLWGPRPGNDARAEI